MKRSILRRFALFSAAAFAIALCVSLAVSLWNCTTEIVNSYNAIAGMAADESKTILTGMTYDDVVSGNDDKAYERRRRALREIAQIYGAEYLYLFEVDPATETRTYLFCVAGSDKDDEKIRDERPLGSKSYATLSEQEQKAVGGSADDTPEVLKNKFGFLLCWYFPFELEKGDTSEDAMNPLVLGVDFDAQKEQEDIFEYTLTFAVPMAIVATLIVALELLALKKGVSDPLRKLSGRMRSFTQDGVLHQSHVAVSNTAEIADIETSFNQMTDDIQNYVERIAKMREERATAEAELEVARRIQIGLVPPTRHCEGSGFDAFAFERTARAVGGDFYDLIELDDGKLICVIADVSGKGMSAALFMAMFRTLLHDNLQRRADPAHVLNKVNDIVVHNNPENMFVTLVAAVYDPSTRTLTYANAGHTPPLIVGGAYLSPDPGIALGLFEDAGIVNETLTLEPGQGVFLYTDGATEAVNPHNEFFGEERLAQAVRHTHDAQSTVRAAVDEVDTFAGEREQFDDLTLLAVFATGSDANADPTGWKATLEPELSSFQELREHIMRLCGDKPQAKQAVLACDECFANVVNYAQATSVEVELHATESELVARIADDGTPFDPLAYEPDERMFEDFDMGGMGIVFMREAASAIAYERTDGKNVLTLRFEL